MALGRFIRSLFGRHERAISEAYRAIFFDLDAYVDGLREWVPAPARILEVGAGEGAVTERLARAYPDADITAIDIDPRVGRLYGGRTDTVHFRCTTIEDFARDHGGAYDLIVLADVLHHVPLPLRLSLLGTVRTLLAHGGAFAFKEWERGRSPIYWLGYVSDRWITGDRIRYMTRAELLDYLAPAFGTAALAAEQRVRPWWNNLSLLVRP